MKKITNLTLLFLFCLSGCIWTPEESNTLLESNYEPVILERVAFENSIELQDPKTISETGKIYIKDSYLFINEPNEGYHVFDNSNPRNPIKKAFIKVPGSSDIAIKDNILYFNTATDLIAVEPNSTYSAVSVTKRVANVFPEMISPDGFYYRDLQENEVIVNWILID